MKLVYPHGTSGKPYRIYESATMAIGSVTPGKRLKINGEERPVSPKGFFAVKVDLHDGGNLIRCQQLEPDGRVMGEASATVEVALPLAPLAYDPLRIHPETVAPQHDIGLLPGDSFKVSVSASVGSEVGVVIPGIINKPVWLSPVYPDDTPGYIDNRTMVFKELHQTQARIAKEGYYEGTVTIPPNTWPMQNVPIKLVLRNDYQERTLDGAGRLSVWITPRMATVHTDRAVARKAPHDNAERVTPPRTGVSFMIDRQEGDWVRGRVGNEEVWVEVRDAVIDDNPPPFAAQSITGVWTCRVSERAATLGLAFSSGRPFAQITGEQDKLTVFVPGVLPAVDDLKKSVVDASCTNMMDSLTVVSDQKGTILTLNVPGLCGYDYHYSAQGFEILIKRLPKTPVETRVVIDPGHGGAESGSVGPSGLPEKDLNLTVSKQLAMQLKSLGFQVTLSRTADTALALKDRSAFALNHNADIVLSVHHNALPDGRDPSEHEGSCTFYYHNFSKPLAEKLEDALVKGAKTNRYGVFHESLYMARIHQSLAVLIEIGFFTKPDEFERLIDPAFQSQATAAMAQAVSEFVNAEATLFKGAL